MATDPKSLENVKAIARRLETTLIARENLLRDIENWWLTQGMQKASGAPECIFRLRALNLGAKK